MAPVHPALPLAPKPPRRLPASTPDAFPASRLAPPARELWGAIVLPALMLEVRPAPAGIPLAAFDPLRRVILAVNEAAADAGVRPGQSTTTAWAMCPSLATFVRNPGAEERALARLAGWAGQFSPRLALEQEGVVLEIGSSLRLFGGLGTITDKLEAGLAALGYRYRLGIAPTPLAALWRARAGASEPVTETNFLASAIAPLPLDVMNLDAHTRVAIAGLGLSRIGGLLRLPRPGLARRYGPGLIRMLDRALGKRPDPRLPWQMDTIFAGAVELPIESESMALVALAFRRLAEELAGFARARDAAIRQMIVILETERRVIETTLQCHASLRDPERILGLIVNRLESLELPAPVRKTALRVEDFVPHVPEQELAIGEKAMGSGLAPLLMRIAAKLGDHAVVRLALAPDHRPERASRECGIGERVDAGGIARCGWPLFMLSKPQRLAEIEGWPSIGGKLERETGPERIESGWWDGADVARDYYRMRARDGAELWVFHDRSRGGWYLHGHFA